MPRQRPVYVVYRKDVPICTGTLEYCAEMTGMTKDSIRASATRRSVERRSYGAVRVEMPDIGEYEEEGQR